MSTNAKKYSKLKRHFAVALSLTLLVTSLASVAVVQAKKSKAVPTAPEIEMVSSKLNLSDEQTKVLSWLNLNKAACVAAANVAVSLPVDRAAAGDSPLGAAPAALVMPFLLPVMDAPPSVYSILQKNKIVQTVFDIEVDAAGLGKNCILTFEKPNSNLLRELSKIEHADSHSETGGENSWRSDGKTWHVLGLDSSHVLLTTQAKEHHASKRIRFKAAGAGEPINAVDSDLSFIPERLKSLLRGISGSAPLWQVLDTSVVPKESGDKFMRQLQELAASGTTVVEVVSGSGELKATVHSSEKTAPDMLRRELSDFKEPAEFSVAQSTPDNFVVTISGDDNRALKAKVFLLLLLGPLTAI